MAVDTNQQNNLFAPPTKDELSGNSGMFSPPSQDELFAPPKPEELGEEPKAPDYLQDQDFQKIGQKYGVDPNELRSLAPYYGAKVAGKSLGEAAQIGLKGTAGFLGESAGLNIPQFVYKKLQNEPMRKALDELSEIGSQQQSIPEKAAQFAVPFANAPAALTKSALGRIGTAAGIGATAGLAGSKEGQEAKSAGVGAALGAGLGVAGEGIGALLARKYKPNQIEEALYENQTASKKFDLEKGIQDISERTKNSENMMEEIGFGGKNTLSRPEVDTFVKEQLGEENFAKYLDPASEEGHLIRSRMEGPKTEEAIKEQLVNDIIENRARSFAEDLTGTRVKDGAQAFEDIEKFASRQGSEAVRNRYKDFLRLEQADKFINESGLRAVSDPNFFGRAANFMSDNQFVFRHLDDKYGTRLEDTVRDLNRAYNRSTFSLREFRDKYDNMFKAAKANGTDEAITGSSKIYDALDSGNMAGLTPQEADSAKEFKGYFDNILDFVNGVVKEKDPRIAPMSIPKRENYVPKMLKATPDLVGALEKKLAQTSEELSQQFGRKIDDLAELTSKEFAALKQNESGQDLIRALGIIDNNIPKNGAELSSRLKEMMYSRDGNIALESAARAAMERSGQIPDFMLEKDLYRLARRYTDNTIRHLYLRNGIDKLRYQAKALTKAGADVEANYVQNLIRDLLGVRKGTAAEAMLQGKIKVARGLDSLIEKYGKDSPTGSMLVFTKGLPDWLQFWTRQIYPNVLGWNARAALQNATQSITKLAPELGTKYGYTTLLRGAVHTLGNWNRLLQKVESSGSVPAEFTRKGEQAIAEGIARSSLVRLPRDTIEALGKVGMVLFQATEKMNRALTMGTAEMMAHDISRGSNLALSSLAKFPTSVRQSVLKEQQNPEVVADILGRYLNDVTQYNYNKVSMSEFGRTMGPFFSTFSKWPTATAGDIINEIRSKGLIGSVPRNFEKYIAPFLLLQTVDYLAGERMGDKESLSDRQKKLMGASGLSQSAPIGSTSAILSGQVFTPPAVDAIMQGVIKPVLEGKVGGDTQDLPEKVGDMSKKFAGTMVKNFFPGAGLVRFITDDLVTFATGQAPQGKDFFEKTAEGAKDIAK